MSASPSMRLSTRQRVLLSEYVPGICLLPVCAYFVLVPFGTGGALGLPWLIVHSFNLLAHEAGHFLFGFFGELVMYAGGSLLQLLLPCAFLSTAVRTDSRLGAQISLLWLGQNWIDVSVYAADAVTRSLPLLGGMGTEGHDWFNILWRLGWLEHTALVAGSMVALAYVTWALMLAAPRWIG